MCGIGGTFSIEFASALEDVPTTFTSLSYNTNVFLWYFAYVVTGPLTHHFGWRKTAFYNSLIASVSFAALAFTSNLVALYTLYGLIFGETWK